MKNEERHKMNIISSSITKKEDSQTKQDGKNNNKASSSSSSSPWLRLKDPRIVRVSRAFGGKDRHSKVCTIRGLRDRRVRLSVPTAIQLYDLQDRLGLNQPSKAVDWLLSAAKQEIDQLPPLPIAPLNFTLNHHHHEKQDQSNQGQLVQFDHHRGTTHNSHCSSSGTAVVAPYGSYFQLDHHNHHHSAGFASQSSADHHDLQNLNIYAVPLSLASGSSQIFVPQTYFPAVHNLAPSGDTDTDPRQTNQFQMFSSNTQNLFPNSNPYSMNDQSSETSRGFSFNIGPRLFSSNSTEEGCEAADKDIDFPCK